jgi:predicted nucleic acid-binding protein
VTVYLDTSSLVKLYVVEPDSAKVQDLVNTATAIVTSIISYAEARATFARLLRKGIINRAQSQQAARQLDVDWSRFIVMELRRDLGHSAGRLADVLALSGADAVHLASFEALISRCDDDDVKFSCADDRLVRAARSLGRS